MQSQGTCGGGARWIGALALSVLTWAGFTTHAAEVRDVRLKGEGAEDGVVTITRDPDGRMVLRDADVPDGVRLGELGTGQAPHAGLTGLLADDHPQYLNDTRHAQAHPAEFNAGLALPPDLNGNTTLGAHVRDANLHVRRDGAETISGPWSFTLAPRLAAGLRSGGALRIEAETDPTLASFSQTVTLSQATAWHYPEVVASVPRPAPEGTAWLNPEQARFAEMLNATNAPAERTQLLRATGFGLELPEDARVLGVEIQARLVAGPTGGNSIDDYVGLVVDGLAQGQNRAGGITVAPSDMIVATWGGPGDRLGLELTGAQVNAAEFGAELALRPAQAGEAVEVGVDYLALRVHYAVTEARRYDLRLEPGGELTLGEPGQAALALVPGSGMVAVANLLLLGQVDTPPAVVNGALCNIQGQLRWGHADAWHPLD